MSTRIPAPAAVKRGRLYLIVLILLFLLPLVVAWLMVGRWQPGGSVHHGELLDPARPLPALNLQRLNGEPLTLDQLRGRWHLVYLGTGTECGPECRDSLYNMRQVRLALGRDSIRLSNLLLLDRPPNAELGRWLQQEHPAMLKARGDGTVGTFLREAFPTGGEGPWVYLLDPLGNLVMRYGAASNADGMLEDLERLLKYSRIG